MTGRSIALDPAAGVAAADAVPRLDLFMLPGGAPRSCVVVCPGGGYTNRADHEGEPVARWLNSLGISAAVLHYRVSPHRHPVPLGDARQAIRTVRVCAGELGVDPRRVGILGFSAGGHLATSCATVLEPESAGRRSSRPDLLVACYPVITFGEFRHDGSMQNLLGPDAPPELGAELSLENRVTPETPPAFIWHTAEDAAVPVENSLLLAGALARSGVPFELHVFPHGPHGLGLGEPGSAIAAWTGLCARWLRGQGFGDQSPGNPTAWPASTGAARLPP